MHFSTLRLAVLLLFGLGFSMDSRAISASTDSHGQSVEHPSKFTNEQYSNNRQKHQDVAPPEPELTQRKFDSNCALFAEYATLTAALPKTFNLLDKNQDGVLTKEELIDSIEDRRLVDATESGLLAGFYAHFDRLSGLSPTFWGGKKFDRDTLKVLLETVKKSELALHIVRTSWQWTSSSEPAEFGLDFEKGCIKQSLLKASGNPHKSAAADKSIQYLLANFEHASVNGVVTNASLGNYYRKFRASNDEFKITFLIEDCLEMAQSLKADKHSQSLYWHKNEPLLDIRGDNVIQGVAGDCTFKSALSCLANSRPESIVKMIQQKSADTYSITFPGFKPVDVKAPSLAEQVLYEPDVHSGLWLNLLEQAYGILADRLDEKKQFVGLPFEEKTHLFWRPSDAIGFLTGHKTKRLFFADVNENDAMRELRKAFSSSVKPIVIAGTAEPHDKILWQSHSYSVEKLIPASGSKGEMLVLRNPQGENKGSIGADLTFTPHQFWANFAEVSIEQMK